MMNVDIDSDEDEEELNDLRHLKAVLDADEAGPNEPIPRYAASVASTSTRTANHHLVAPQANTNEPFKIESALALNRLYDEKLKRLEKVLSSRLLDCRSKLKEIQGQSPITDKQETFRYINCGKPYFRDKSNFPAPDNDDTIMVKSQMYDFSQIMSVPGWTVRDKSQFVSMMHKMSKEIKKDELRSKIAALRRQRRSNKSSNINKLEIEALEKEISKIKDQPLNELALPLDREYDWDTIANKLNKRHTPQEYQALWKLFFHPSINKNSWSVEEHAALQCIARELGQQDWDEIAKKLDTGRTGYQCFVYYKTNMTNLTNGQKWSSEEVTYLKRLIEYFKQDNYIPWGKIAAAMENRNKIQIYNKYLRLIELRKGRFLPEEDAVILNCVKRFGEDFKKMTDYLPGRSLSQLRTRYKVIKNFRISTVWTVEDDRKLMQIISNQDSEAAFSEATKHFPGKTRTNIRSRYVTLAKWTRRNPLIDIQYAPRRGARRLNHGLASDDLNRAIEDLKNTLQAVAEVKTSKKKITETSSETDIEDAIIATLINERLKEEENQKYPLNDKDTSIIMKYDQEISPSDLNSTNLNKCLVILESRLNREKFNESEYREQHPRLGVTEQEVCLVRIKSYSRKEMVSTVKVDGTPDVWGNIMLSRRKYVLPPHYATITGCRALMAYVSNFGTQLPNIMIRKNAILKKEYDKLVDRFYILFLWPMLLSNEGPMEGKKLEKAEKFRRPLIPSTPLASSLSTCVRVHRKYRGSDVAPNGIIDLQESDEKDEITIKENLSNLTDTYKVM